MNKQTKNFANKISQAGSLMIEAMAMLALISLVTPTLYKKSAERTTELQDINTATHIRTVMKAVDNYAAANYQELIADLSEGQVKNIDIDDQTYASYFPYGYKFDDLKNFDKPKVALRRQGNSITSFVEFPKSIDIGEMRAARIASMVGSNGGYVDSNQNAKGVGGVWSLTKTELGDLNFDDSKGSVVVASSEAINSANSASLENEKYLQRTKVESEDQLWRNAMTTNLYMGGVAEANTMYKILGVDQMIIGSTDYNAHNEDLVITAENGSGDGGSAWLEGNFSALSDVFTVKKDDASAADILAFGNGGGNDTIYAEAGSHILFNGDNVEFNRTNDDTQIGAVFRVNTQVEKELDVFGSTAVATNSGTTFQAGQDGSYITADATHVNLLNNMVDISKSADGSSASSAKILTEKVDITGDTTVGIGSAVPKRVGLNPKLAVQGNAYVSNILEAGEIDTEKFKALELHAGGQNFSDNNEDMWLHATASGVSVNNPALGPDKILDISAGTSAMYGPHGSESGMGSAVILGDTNAQLRGEETASLYTTNADGYVELQNGSMILTGTQDGRAADNRVDIQAATTSVNNGIFQVQKVEGDTGTNSLFVDPSGAGKVEIEANTTTVKPGGTNGVFEVVNKDNIQLLSVLPDGTPGKPQSVAEIDDQTFRVSAVTSNGKPLGDLSEIILDVDASNYEPKSESERNVTSDGSIYIRRGAVELESSSGTGNVADSGTGYIEAGRFVANTKYNNSTIDEPVYSADYINSRSKYETGNNFYDRYMVNPAYTSVMHDIKLTTRGGARLSDILPDFINKGIYVVNNTYKDNGLDIDNIQPVISGNRVLAQNAEEVPVGTALGGANQWASPFLGIVPAPQCPPGYAKVITITPAGFMMAQAGQIVRKDHYVPDSLGGGKRFVVDEYTQQQKLGQVNLPNGSATVTGAQFTSNSFTDQAGTSHDMYYLGHSSEPAATLNGDPFSPMPLYFQQSNWLKSKVQGQQTSSPHACGGYNQPACGDSFVGWSAIMGFVYPGSHYADVIRLVNGGSSVDSGAIYWNVFPVMAQTLEAYATVYCYFDRNNLYNSGMDSAYVDKYDQLNNFRQGYGKAQGGVNIDYINRLNDPTLKYDEPW